MLGVIITSQLQDANSATPATPPYFEVPNLCTAVNIGIVQSFKCVSYFDIIGTSTMVRLRMPVLCAWLMTIEESLLRRDSLVL